MKSGGSDNEIPEYDGDIGNQFWPLSEIPTGENENKQLFYCTQIQGVGTVGMHPNVLHSTY